MCKETIWYYACGHLDNVDTDYCDDARGRQTCDNTEEKTETWTSVVCTRCEPDEEEEDNGSWNACGSSHNGYAARAA
jgi:hypothetical protein